MRLATGSSWMSGQRPVLGAKKRLIRRATTLSAMTRMMRIRAAVQARSIAVLRRESRLRELVVREHRQRGHAPVERVEVGAVDDADGDQQGSGLADHPGDGERDAGREARDGRREDDLEDGPPLRHAQRVGGLPQLVGDELQDLLRRPHDHRDHQHRQRDRAHDAHPHPGAEEDREQGEGEQAGDDRRDAGHHVDEEGDRPLQPAGAVLHDVDGGQQADRHGDDRGEAGDDQRAEDRVVRPAALADDAEHRGGEELGVQPLQALAQHGPDERDQRAPWRRRTPSSPRRSPAGRAPCGCPRPTGTTTYTASVPSTTA